MTFLGFAVAGYFMPTYIKYLIIALSAVAIITFLILFFFKQMNVLKQNISLVFILVSFMIILSMVSSLTYFDSNKKKYGQYYGSEHTIDAVVLSKEYANDYYSRYLLEVKYIDGEKFEHRAPLICEYPATLEAGDKISAIVTATEPENQNGQFNEKASMISDGMFINYLAQQDGNLAVNEYTDFSVELTLSIINNKLSNIIINKIGGEEGNLTSALFLGNRNLISDTVSRDFTRTGASHILALSGMHMTIIMGAAMFVLKRITENYKLISGILSIMAVFYLGLTGFSVSATRSVLMLLIFYLSYVIDDDVDTLTSLSMAGFLIILVSPGAVLDAGFWMSFSATLGIITYVPVLNDSFWEWASKFKHPVVKILMKLSSKLIIAISTSIFAIVPLIAVMCIFIKEISLFSIISSLVLAVPSSLILLMTLFLLPLSSIPYISSLLSQVIRLAARFMIDFCEKHSDIEDILISLNYPFAALMAILVGGAILYSLIVKHKHPFTSLVPFAICVALFISTAYLYEYSNRGNVKVSYINASSTSDLVVLSNEKDIVICDISNGSKSSYYKVIDEMYEVRATEIKAIVLSRYSNLHTSTLFYVFSSEKVRELWLPYPDDGDDYYMMERLYSIAQQNDVNVYMYKYGETLKMLDKTRVKLERSDIKRSQVPIFMLTAYTSSEQSIYISPGFNESDLSEKAQFELSNSDYVIFGNKGPRTKSQYTIDEPAGIRGIAFADDIRAAHFIKPEHYYHGYYIVPEEFEFYMDKN